MNATVSGSSDRMGAQSQHERSGTNAPVVWNVRCRGVAMRCGTESTAVPLHSAGDNPLLRVGASGAGGRDVLEGKGPRDGPRGG